MSRSSGARASFVITIRAKPRSRVSALEPAASGPWIARLRAAPSDGRANAELVGLVAEHFRCSRSAVTVITGASARLKRVRVDVEPRGGR